MLEFQAIHAYALWHWLWLAYEAQTGNRISPAMFAQTCCMSEAEETRFRNMENN